MTIEELYAERCHKPREYDDIWEHLPTLKNYAGHCSHITEFGVRTGNSTTAFLYALSRNGGKLISYDIEDAKFTPPPIVNVTWNFHKRNTADYALVIEPTELLFIDSCHDYPHIVKELRHAERAARYIIMHDTSATWRGGIGPLRAMSEFVQTSPWRVKEHFENCNGLTVLERK